MIRLSLDLAVAAPPQPKVLSAEYAAAFAGLRLARD